VFIRGTLGATLARFAESSGKEANRSFPYAWRYRDYVIDAVNADMPFDRFLAEQIAGDLLPSSNDVERARLQIAAGFLAVRPKNLEEANPLQFEALIVDEQIDTVTRVVMANSVACACCHDHKFDPFPMQDFYALAEIFASTKTYFGTFISPANRVGGDSLPLPRGAHVPIFHASIPLSE
jgi:xanthine/CO dehydrogenase XdhC/CoxF family maturation factor